MNFSDEVSELTNQIPEGHVSTYGVVARALGDVKASRAVFDFLSRTRRSHRVVNSQGRVKSWQVEPLRKEGIEIEGETVCDLNRLLFKDFRTSQPLKRLREEQDELAKRVILEDGFEKVESVCGFDLAYEDARAICAYAVVETGSLEVTESDVVAKEVEFPYIPGYLAYREFPAIEVAYRRTKGRPDLLLIDGHGLMHPRRAGIACHVGVMLEKPTIGVAKNLLVGRMERSPAKEGDFQRVLLNGDTLGHALRSSPSKLIYVSPGNLVSLDSSVRIVKDLCKTRIPEPLRVAHATASSARGKA